MKIVINNEKREVPRQTNILELLSLLSVKADQPGMAVAVNQKVVPRKVWETTLLNDQDDVLLIRASQGG